MTAKGTKPLTYTERKTIEEGIKKGLSTIQIASLLKRSINPVKVEIRINGGREGYESEKAQQAADLRKENRFKKISFQLTHEQENFIAESLERKIPLLHIANKIGIKHQLLSKIIRKKFPGYKPKTSWQLYERIDHLENIVEAIQQQIDIIFDLLKEKNDA